jgi:hypothetical protein
MKTSMDFLLNCGISEDILRKVEVNNSKQTILDAEWNMERVVSSIDYLNRIGIKQINKILINRFDIVLRGEKNLKEKFEKIGTKELVDKINKDIKNICYLDKY